VVHHVTGKLFPQGHDAKQCPLIPCPLVKRYKMGMNCVAELSELHSALPLKCSLIPDEKLNIVPICVMPLTVPILRAHKKVCDVQCLNPVVFS
jgi:hypothetical protein